MKKWVLQVGLVLFAVFGFLFITGSSNRKSDLYKNMVNASVYLDGRGSGVFIDDNVILTAAHVIEGQEFFCIRLRDGTLLKSSDFYIDKKEDIGFIFVEAEELHIAKVSPLSAALGDPVYLVGRPYEDKFLFSLTKGIISHLSRDFPNYKWKDLLQTDVDGGSGCSGGPLYNSDGNLVGMYVGQVLGGGRGISLCESIDSILEAYERCKLERIK